MMRDAHVASIMGSEDQLVPEAAEPKPRRAVPSQLEEEVGKSGKEGIPAAFDKVREIIAVVEPFIMDPLIQLTVFHPNRLLAVHIKRRVFGNIGNNLLLSSRIKEERLRLQFVFFALGI